MLSKLTLLLALIGANPLPLFGNLQANAEVRAAGGFWVWDVQCTFEVSGAVLHQLKASALTLAPQVEALLLGGTIDPPIVGSVSFDSAGRGLAVFSWVTTSASTGAPPRPFMRVTLGIKDTVLGGSADAGVGGGGLRYSRVAGAVCVVHLPFTEAPTP